MIPDVEAPPAAWYPDPAGEATWRWWNGERWTEHVAEPPTGLSRPWFPTRDDRTQSIRGGGIALSGFVVGELLSVGVVLVAIALGASSRSVLTFALGAAGLWSGLLGACMLAVRRHGTGSLRDLGLLPLRWSDLGIGVVASIVARVAAVIVAVILVLLLPDESFGEGTSIVDADRVSVVGMIVVGAIVVLGAAFFEELFFRGLVQGVLTGRLGGRAAILVQCVAFAAVHYQIGMTAAQVLITFTTIALVGLLLGVLRWRYERLGPGIVMHAAFNLVAVVLTS